MAKSKRSRKIKNAGKPDKSQSDFASIVKIKPRAPSGRLSRPDRRAAERPYTTHQERCAAIGTALWSPDKPLNPNNPRLHSALGRMELAGKITGRENEAGRKYARLMRDASLCACSPTLSSGSLDGSRGGASVEDQERVAKIMDAAAKAQMVALMAGGNMDAFGYAIDRDIDPAPQQVEGVAKILTALADHFF